MTESQTTLESIGFNENIEALLGVRNFAGRRAFFRKQQARSAFDAGGGPGGVLDPAALLRASGLALHVSLVSGAGGLHDRDSQAGGTSGGREYEHDSIPEFGL